MRTGLFITLEGVDGSGKTTMREAVVEHLRSKGIPVITTREPGGTPFAERIREMLLAPSDEPINIKTETALFFAARQQHITQVIEPNLKKGYCVVSDRFTDSAYSYQYAKGISFEELAKVEAAITGFYTPDHTLYYDIDFETSRLRQASRGRLIDRMETEFYENFAATVEGYRRRINDDPARFTVIDAKRSLEEVKADTLKHINAIIG